MQFHETEQTLFKHKAKIKLVPIKVQDTRYFIIEVT